MSPESLYGTATAAEPQPPASPPAGTAKPTAGARFRLLNAFVDFSMRELLKSDAGVWLVLFRLTDAETNTVRADYADIARRVGCSASTVKRSVQRLRGRKLLAVVRQGGFQRGPSTFRVLAGES